MALCWMLQILHVVPDVTESATISVSLFHCTNIKQQTTRARGFVAFLALTRCLDTDVRHVSTSSVCVFVCVFAGESWSLFSVTDEPNLHPPTAPSPQQGHEQQQQRRGTKTMRSGRHVPNTQDGFFCVSVHVVLVHTHRSQCVYVQRCYQKHHTRCFKQK